LWVFHGSISSKGGADCERGVILLRVEMNLCSSPAALMHIKSFIRDSNCHANVKVSMILICCVRRANVPIGDNPQTNGGKKQDATSAHALSIPARTSQ
jgi:hypothetical protein